MITAYDWMKSAPEQNNFQKDSEEFSRRKEMTRKVCFRAKICEKDLLLGKTVMIWILT